MRKLTTREKVMIGLCGVVAIVILTLFVFRPLLNQWRSAGEEIASKQQELEIARRLVNFEPTAVTIEDRLRVKTGLEGKSIISDEQFKQLQEKLTVGKDNGNGKLDINKATRASLTKLGLDKYLVNSILAYRDQIGGFNNLEQLKEIRGSIFEGQLAEAIISQKLAELIKSVGIGRIDRLDAKLVKSKKKEDIPRDVKKFFINEIYLNELEAEIQRISALRQAGKSEGSQKSNDDLEPIKVENQHREFPPLPAEIPDELKLNIAKAIIANKGDIKQKSITQEGKTKEEALQLALDRLKATEEEVDVKVLDAGSKGIWGFFAKPVKIRVTMKEDEQGITTGFREALAKYNEQLSRTADAVGLYPEETIYDDGYYFDETDYDWDESYYDEDYDTEADESNSDEAAQVASEKDKSTESDNGQITPETTVESNNIDEGNSDKIDENMMVSKLSEYLVEVSQKKNDLQRWLYRVPTSYQKQSYVVEVVFKCNIAQLATFMYKIESSFRWLSVRDLKISIANAKNTMLSADISVLATVL